MEEIHSMQESETASVIKVAREPAIIINGVPDLPPDVAAESQPEPSNAAEPQVDHHFGEWLEGRKVRKPFGDKYFVGKVDKYDSESNWYNVVYQDGDQEDLEWNEVEEVLLPLDITIPLKTLISDKFGLQNTVPVFKPKVGRPRKVYAITDGNTNNVMEDQMMTGAANEHQPNNLLALVPASTSNDASGGQLVTVTAGVNAQASNDASGGQLVTVTAGVNAQAYVNASSQPRKRGRPRKDATMYPRKDATIPANTQPKKRGRPPKNRNLSGNAQSAECTPNSLATVPVQDARRLNSVLIRNAQTARAEKLAKAERLKRENMHVQGAPPGTQFL